MTTIYNRIKNLPSKIYEVTVLTIKSELARLASIFYKKKSSNIWLICESQMQAQENGYQLFLYIRTNFPELDTYYVINKKSPSINKVIQLGNVLIYNSFKQILFMHAADKIISTHGLWMIPNEIGILKKYTKKNIQATKIMLNHGVGFLKNGKKFYHKNIFLLNNLILALSEKHKKIFTNEYGYDDGDVIITGYPRFDTLIDLSSKCEFDNLVTFMPTFRDYDNGLGDDLFNVIKNIMTDQGFQEYIKENNITFYIYLHQDIQKYNYLFDQFSSERIKIIKQGEFSVTELLQKSKCLITDYSSVLFDFVYMKKPFISYQFDLEKFTYQRDDKAFIDFKKDLPGYRVETHIDLIKKIKSISGSNYTFPDKHAEQAKKYFTYNDQNNTERVFNAIMGAK